jgi:prevent-host-death family protein
MKKAAVAELKASLSRYLAFVRVGEEVLITDRGNPIARIVPLGVPVGKEEQRLRRMEAHGLLRVGSGKLPKGFWEAPRPEDPAGRIRRALLEERREGR